jgi:probable HAF family extracellular repeat protein
MQRILLPLLASFAGVSSAATITFSFEKLDLGFTPTAMNNRGWIAGYGPDAVGRKDHPYRYRPGVGTERLSALGGQAWDINDDGTVVGWLERKGADKKAFVRPAGEPWADLGTLGGRNSWATAINESGQVVGTSWYNDLSGAILFQGFTYSEGTGMTSLAAAFGLQNFEVADVNASGQMIGSSYGYDPVLFYDPLLGVRELYLYGGWDWATGRFLNDDGVVVAVDAGFYSSTVVFSGSFASRIGGAYHTVAHGLNDKGWIVGRQQDGYSARPYAFLYRLDRGGPFDLNGMVPGIGTWLERAVAVNDRGRILALGEDGEYYLLAPVRTASASVENPEPSTLALIACGLGMALVRRFRLKQPF